MAPREAEISSHFSSRNRGPDGQRVARVPGRWDGRPEAPMLMRYARISTANVELDPQKTP